MSASTISPTSQPDPELMLQHEIVRRGALFRDAVIQRVRNEKPGWNPGAEYRVLLEAVGTALAKHDIAIEVIAAQMGARVTAPIPEPMGTPQ